MRYVKIGKWSSAVDDWTVCSCTLSAPQYRRSTVTVPGRDGVIDLSDALDGAVHYDTRKLTIRLENSAGTRELRESRIQFMLNALDGTEQEIELPDDHDRILRGRVRISVQYSDAAHAAVQITADVEPFRYKKSDTEYRLQNNSGNAHDFKLRNNGRKIVIPAFQVYNIMGTAAINGHEITSAGKYQYPDIRFPHGENILTMTGQIAVVIRFREGVL